MAWTSPHTFAVNEIATSPNLNAVQDNIRWLGGADSRGTTFPSSPIDGQLYTYTADATNGVQWTFKYNAGSASAYKWEFFGGSPMYASVETAQSANFAGASGDLATVGPAITVPRAGDYRIEWEAQGQVGASPDTLTTGIAIGATGMTYTVLVSGQATNWIEMKGSVVWTGRAASDSIRVRYNCGNQSNSWQNRRLHVTPVRVS